MKSNKTRTFGSKHFVYLIFNLVCFNMASGQKLELVVQTGHSGFIHSVAFSPDGKLLASGSGDDTVRIWNVETGQQIRCFEGHTSMAVAFSPDGKTLASGSKENSIELWDVETGQQIRTLEGHSDVVWTVAFSPDGAILASGSEDGSIKLWNIKTGQPIKVLTGGSGEVYSVTFSPNGKMLASASFKRVDLWNLETGQQIESLEGHDSWVTSVAFSPNGKTLASGGADQTIRLWDVGKAQQIQLLTGHNSKVNSVAFSPDGKVLASGAEDSTVRLWDVEKGRETRTLTGHDDWFFAVSFSPDGKTLASGGSTIELWNPETGQVRGSLVGHASPIQSVALSPDGKTLATGMDENPIALWDLGTGRLIKSLEGKSDQTDTVAFSHNGNFLAAGTGDTVELWNVKTGELLNSFHGQNGQVYSVAFSPDNTILAAGGNNSVDLWDIETGQKATPIPDKGVAIYSVQFSPDGKTLALGRSDKVIELWNVKSEKLVSSLKGHTDAIYTIAYSPDGKILATGGDDNTIRLWDTDTGQQIKVLDGHSDRVSSVAFSPNGKTLASGSYDKTIKLWDLETGKQLRSLVAETYAVESIAFAAQGNLLVSGGLDMTVKVWNLEKNEPLVTLTALDKSDWAAITPDGRFDASEGALKLMHYSYGLEVIGLEQLKEAYYEPGLLQKLLGYSKEPLRSILPLKDVKLHPEVIDHRIGSDSTKLTIKLKNRGGGIGKVQVFLGNELGNKLVVDDARDPALKANPDVPEATITVDLKGTNYLPGKDNKITVVTSNYLKEIGRGNIQSRGAQIVWRAPGTEAYTLPTLYAIVGGVSDYAGDGIDLRFAAKDAEDFSYALSLGAKKLFCPASAPNCIDKVNITTLSTSGKDGTVMPTKENFKRAVADIAAKAKPEDIFVMYLAGHGVSFGAGTDTYFYLTQDARSASKEDLSKVLATATISSEEMTDWLTPNKDNPNDIFIKAMKQVVILDTCAAGTAAAQLALTAKRDLSGDQIRAIEFLKDKTGTFVLMASTADAPSYEASAFGQGLLTYSLLQGMKGAALNNGADIDVQTLFDYAQKQVPRLAPNVGGVQQPIVSAPSGKTFLIGQMSDIERQKVPLASSKPLILRPLLTNPETGDDDLKLIPELRKRLDAESSYEFMRRSGKGNPLLIYVDDDSFPHALRVTGTYTVEGTTVRIRAYLRRDGKTVSQPMEITAPRDKVIDELMAAIRDEMSKIKSD